ncbi:MAG: DUF1566 domain-containing protein [Clostridiaceae bacterium]|nr:DUF1566 domain-containing protein [Clostridiaceae bacterium]
MRLEESFGAFPETPLAKLDGSGSALPPGADWAAGARMIHDRNTGLFWELKSPEAGSVNDCGARYTFAECGAYLSRLNAARFGGFDDWRLPNRDELRSLMDYGREDCALDPAVFENAPVGDYWTKNVHKKQPWFAWTIFSGFGCAVVKSMESRQYVMAVRGGDGRFGEWYSGRFTDHGDGTVTDHATGLMWQKGTGERTAPETAETLCAEMTLAGYTDWRLPNIKELGTILNPDENSDGWFYEPFEAAEGGMFHYAASTVFRGQYAWVVNFTMGYDGYYGSRQAPLFYRAVRTAGAAVPAEAGPAPFIVTHTGQTAAHDLKGRLVAPDRIKGLDAARVTLPMRFAYALDGQTFRDENTGLTWDAGHPAVRLPWKEAAAFIRGLNAEAYGGHTDWRLPEREELRSIADYGRTVPAASEAIPTAADFYWTAAEHKLDRHLAWSVYFGYGCCIGFRKDKPACVRAVCGGKLRLLLPAAERFEIHPDGTVTDTATGLMWMQDEPEPLALRDALEFCTALRLGGYDDWALPNLKELGTLVNLSEGEQWYFSEVFPDTNTKPQGFYQSTTAFDETFGWGCNFQFGFDGYYADRMCGKYPFRPVRRVNV